MCFMSEKLLFNEFVGRGHDPADQLPFFALVPFNESAFISLRFGGVMTPPYEALNNNSHPGEG